MNPFRSFLFMLTCIFACTACGQIETERSQSQSFLWNKNYWENYSAIPVCFVNQHDIRLEVLGAYTAIIKNEFYEKTPIRFVNWSDCTPTDEFRAIIRVRFDTSSVTVDETSENWSAKGGYSNYGANSLPADGEPFATMRLEAPEKWYDLKNLRDYFLSAALHEFGHAVGLLHEHQRTDAVDLCINALGEDQDRRKIPNGEVTEYFGDYDSESVMNYCSAYKTTLSDGDVAGINEIIRKAYSGEVF